MRKLLTISALMTVGMMTSIAFANKPDEIQQVFESENPVGKAKFEFFFFDVYTSTFWSDAGEWDTSRPYALSNLYHRAFSGQDLVDKTLEEMQRIDNVPQQALASYRPELQQVFPDVQKGDRITALYKPETGTVFYHNGQQTGVIEAEAFAVPFFNIWLSDKSLRPELSRILRGR